jgi:ribosomal protein RSM22 (predicted rRNA methylase)
MQSALTTPADLVVASYSLGEIDPVKRIAVEETLWSLTQKVLLIVEPGTPKGFNSLRETRKRLLDKGAHLIGPCPHSNACPMASEDWCHFYARLNRSSLHRRAKGAERNYEDEKFSYMAFSREPAHQCSSRILRHPRIGKGHVQLTLCTPEGIKDCVATKKDKDLYKLAKKSTWGDTFS